MGNYWADKEFRSMTLVSTDLDQYRGRKRLSKKVRAALLIYIIDRVSLEVAAGRGNVHWRTLSEAAKEVKADRMRREADLRLTKAIAEQQALLEAEILRLFDEP